MLAVQKIRRMPFSSRTRMRRIFVCVLSRHPPRHNQRICARSWGSGSQYAMQASLQASAKAIISAGPSGTDSPLMIPHYENVLSLLRLQSIRLILLLNIAFYRFLVDIADRFHIVASRPEMPSIPCFVFRMRVEQHQCALPLNSAHHF